MKIILSLLIYFHLFGQMYSQSYTDSKGNIHLWGNVAIEDIRSETYKDWYEKNTKDYEPVLTKLDGEKFKDIKVKVFLGTWCGDTKYLLPKFIEEWESMELDISNLEFVGLHNKGDNYKQGPDGETIGLNIHRVPTFIFYDDEKELGRIVERTVFSLYEDMLAIVTDSPYEERYQAEKMVYDFINTYEGDSLVHKKNLNEVYKKVYREISSSGELNTLGYVLMAQSEMEKAEFVFLLNKYLFPFDPNIRDSYGELLKELGRYEEAKDEYEEVIRLKGSDENAVRQLGEIYELIEKI